LFDCTGTLQEASRRRAAEVLVKAGLPMSAEEALELQQDLAQQRGPHFPVFDEIGRRYGLSEEDIDRAYRAYNSDEVGQIELFPDVMPTISFLHAHGILCFLLTSGVHRRQATKIKALGIEDAFDDIVINDVERGAMLSECLRYLLDKHGLHPGEALVVGDRPQEEIHIGNDLGATTVQMMHGRFAAFEPRDERDRPDYRITRVFQVPTLLRLANMNKSPEALRIVAIGGGTGLPIVLEGCKTYSTNLTAIVTVTDSGRSSGRLREELGMLPPGDARNCLVALSESGPRERLINQLFQYRFKQGSFEGMSLGNLAIAAMVDMKGSFQGGLRAMTQLLNTQGKVVPPTDCDCHVCAELADGTVREGEFNVRELDKPSITRLYLKPEAPPAYHEAVQDILNADIVVIGPGSLYTSVISNLLVPGIRDAIARSKALTLYVGNIMTQPGQTTGLGARAHLEALVRHLGEGVLDYALFNSSVPDAKILERYQADGAAMVTAAPELAATGVRIVEADMVEDLDEKRVLWEKQDLLRHHPDKLADTVCRIYAGLSTTVQ
jgi:uncharacterized cofD-like protein